MNSSAGITVPRRLMAIGAHADDLEIHAGGTLAKYHSLGYEIVYVMATNNMSGSVQEVQPDGSTREFVEPPRQMMARRKRECDLAAAALGTAPIHLDHPQRHCIAPNGKDQMELRYGCTLPDGVPVDVPTILTAGENKAAIARLADLILEKDPECVLTHGICQGNIEHFATALLVTRAFWLATEKGYPGGLVQWREAHTLHGDFHCRWETHVDYSGFLDRKMELIGLHACQMPDTKADDFGHRLLSTWYGKVCGCEAAEVYTWVRRPLRRDSTGPAFGEFTFELLQNAR